MSKRLRAPRAKPGELKAQWGKLPHDRPDICYVWGDGISKADSHLLHNVLTGRRLRIGFIGEEQHVIDPSFMEELETRGYDITTLKFSISKKRLNDGPMEG